MSNYWLKQDKEHPLFSDLLWSRPENKHTRGKLLIVGGNLQGVAHVAAAFSEADKAGIGSQRILLPDSLRNQVPSETTVIFTPSTPSGSLAVAGFGELLEQAEWADGVLMAGDLGRNSETAVLLEKFLAKYDGQVSLVHDAADYVAHLPQTVYQRRKTLLILTITQAQKLLRNARQPHSLRLDMSLSKLITVLQDFSQDWGVSITTKHHNFIIVLAAGQTSVTSTKLGNEDFWRVPVAASAAVWWLQNPGKPFEALTTSVLEILS